MRKILVVAYACEPLKGSEQGVGWNWVLQLARNNKVHVITRSNNRTLIENNFPEELSNNLFFYYYDTAAVFLKIKKKAKGLYLYYFFWQIGVLGRVKKLTREIYFDYVFQPTFGSLWMPTFLPILNLPFIWGPLGGGECVPIPFLKILPIKDRAIQFVRYFLKYTVYINPFLLFRLCRSKVILVRTKNTMEFIPSWFKHKIRLVLETAIEDKIFSYKKLDNNDGNIQLIITGRLIPIKNILSVVKALEYIPEKYKYTLIIIGSGSDKAKIEKAFAEKAFAERIRLIDELPRSEVLKYLCRSDIYLFPSLHEGGSWALMEAMAVGLPVICLNWTGNAVIIDESSAIGLPVTNPDQFSKDIAASICKLFDSPDLRVTIGENARRRIEHEFNWKTKGKFLETLFEEIEG